MVSTPDDSEAEKHQYATDVEDNDGSAKTNGFCGKIYDTSTNTWYVSSKESLAAEVNNAQSNIQKNIKLTEDINLANTDHFKIEDEKKVKINFNDKTLTVDSSIWIKNAEVELTGKGTLQTNSSKYTEDASNSVIWLYGSETDVERYTVLTDIDGITIKGNQGICVNSTDSTEEKGSYGVIVDLTGTTIETEECGLYVDKCCTKTDNHVPIFNLKDITIKQTGATAEKNGGNPTGIYAAGYAKWSIGGDTKISGVDSAIEVRAGEMTIKGGEFKTTDISCTYESNGNETTTKGSAVAVAQHTTKLPIRVTIEGGKFESGNDAKQIAIVDPEKNGAEYTKNVIVAITSECNLSKDKIIGYYTLKKSEPVCDTYSVDARSLILAGYGYKFDTAKDGIELVTISGTGSDGIIYIGPTVGSTGTETNGYQLLNGTKVEFENVKIKYEDGAKIGFQKYNDLTLDNVTIDASECSTMSYVVSNNNGTTTITGRTSIIAYKEKVALDIYYWPNDSKGQNKYKDGVSVIFDSSFSGSVKGKIEFAIDSDAKSTPKANKGKHSLVIENGNFSEATLVVKSFAEGSEIKIKKAIWNVSGMDLPEGYEWREANGYLTVEKSV